MIWFFIARVSDHDIAPEPLPVHNTLQVDGAFPMGLWGRREVDTERAGI
jgi:hypothetical protein